MKVSLHRISIAHISVVLAAILIGIAFGIGIAPNTVFDGVRPTAFSVYALVAGIAGIAVFVACSVVFLKRAAAPIHSLELNLLDAFLECTPDNIFFKDERSRFLRVSTAMARHSGMAHPCLAVGKTDADIFSAEHANQALADEQELLRTGLPMIAKEEKETWPDGHETWALTTKFPLKDGAGTIIGSMGIAHDITARKQAQLQIQHMGMHDNLTGLPNRILLEDRLSQAIALSERNQRRVGVLMLDLDHFKQVNDSFGHSVGDRLLELVAGRLKSGLRESDTIARLAGDEFAITLPMAADSAGIELVAKNVLDMLSLPFYVDDQESQISASIGICQFPEDGRKPQELMQFAHAAMHEAKKRGRHQFCFFSPGFKEEAQRCQKLESDLRNACVREEFVLHYQPFVSANSDRITGVEALLRWQHPKDGLLPPNLFIPKLEELGQMVEVGNWVLKTACRQAAEWQRGGLPPIRMAVNVSSQQFYFGNLVETVESVLRETRLDPHLLELELTESQSLDDSASTINIMRQLKQLGVSLSLDDFGTGWSSLSYLRHFPIDRIKIDRSFVRDMLNDPADEVVVKSILSLARSLRIACIAEGVETLEERDYLKKHLCPEMQGFLFSRPVPAIEATALLRSAKILPGAVSEGTAKKEAVATAGTPLPQAELQEAL